MPDDDRLPLFPNEPLEQPFVTVANVGDIPEGQGRAYPIGNSRVAVFLNDGSYFAIDDFCPHQGASLAAGYIDDCAVACPMHHWRFSLKDGTWRDNPKISITKYNVRVVGQKIQVQLPQASQEAENSP